MAWCNRQNRTSPEELLTRKRRAHPPAADHYPVVVLSDLHLGMDNSSTDLLLEFLRHTTCDKLILNGDIIDGWRIDRNGAQFSEAQLRVMDALNRKIAEGVDVVYIPGNHDGALRGMDIFGRKVMGIRFEKSLDLTDAAGRRLHVCHGDRFDPTQHEYRIRQKQVTPARTPVAQAHRKGLKKSFRRAAMRARIFMLDKGYATGAKFSTFVDKVSERVTGRPVGLFAAARRAGEAVLGTRGDLEGNAVAYADKKEYDGIICGHFHRSGKKQRDGKLYLNSGDWIESYTALAMSKDGEWKVIEWQKERQKKGLKRSFRQAANDNPDIAHRPATEKALKEINKIWPGR